MKILRGWFGEKKSTITMWSLDTSIYRRFHNVILLANTGTTQIDHLLVSQYGIFIVETKNIKGWIFGSENQAKWTQTLIGEKHSFQNPLRQTFRQKKVLAEFLGLKESLIHPIIHFVGNCQFKTAMPPNVIRRGLSRYIKRFTTPVLLIEEVDRITNTLESYLATSELTTGDHIKSLKERHRSTTVCPRCGGRLIKRTAWNGPNAGSDFLGCDNHPKCRFTRNI